MKPLLYLTDFTFSLILLRFKTPVLVTGLLLSLLISFSMRGYEGIVLANKRRQTASTLGSAILICFFFLPVFKLSAFVVLPAVLTMLFRYLFIFRIGIWQFDETSMMRLQRSSIETERRYDKTKRILDVIVGVALFIVLLPLTGLITLLSYLLNGGPVFIRQERIGKDCRVFTMLKFRTFEVKNGENSITRLGRIIRPLRLDELPQIINVISGDMSLVGPRPELPSFHKLGIDNIPDYSLRLVVKPGLTGWAQINYKYTTTVEEYTIKTAYDLYYVENRSLILDIKCLLKTPFAIMMTLIEKDE